MTDTNELRQRRAGLPWEVVHTARTAFSGQPLDVDDPIPRCDPEGSPPDNHANGNHRPSPGLLTPNVVVRGIAIICLGSLGGVSLLPNEEHTPTSMPWVISVIVMANIVAWTTAIDVTHPALMSWFFRKALPAPSAICSDNAVDENPECHMAIPLDTVRRSEADVVSNNVESLDTFAAASVNISGTTSIAEGAIITNGDSRESTEQHLQVIGLELIGGLAALAYLTVKAMLYQQDKALSTTDVVYALGVTFSIYWLNKFKEVAWPSRCSWMKHWLYHENYCTRKYIFGLGRVLRGIMVVVLAWATWWWIAFRLSSAVKVIRHRHEPDTRAQYFVLMCGLSTEGMGIVIFFLNRPTCWYFGLMWRRRLWMSHFYSMVVALMFLVLALVIGFTTSDKTLKLLLPCTGIDSNFCKHIF